MTCTDCKCNKVCRICPNAIYSQSITVVDDSLVVDIPAGNYGNKCEYCLILVQEVPDTATINQPVAISIGGDTTTLYPLVRCDGTQVTARQLDSRIKLRVKVATNATTGVFRVLWGLLSCPSDSLASLPAPETATAPAPALASTTTSPARVATTTTKTTKTVKEVIA